MHRVVVDQLLEEHFLLLGQQAGELSEDLACLLDALSDRVFVEALHGLLLLFLCRIDVCGRTSFQVAVALVLLRHRFFELAKLDRDKRSFFLSSTLLYLFHQLDSPLVVHITDIISELFHLGLVIRGVVHHRLTLLLLV